MTISQDTQENSIEKAAIYKRCGAVSLFITVIEVIALAAVISIVLEGCTIFGSYTYSVWDFSKWMPKRMIVFFILALLPSVWIIRTNWLVRWTATKDWWCSHDHTHARNVLRTIVAIVVGVVAGMLLGIPLAVIFSVPGDWRCGILASAIIVPIALLLVNRRAVIEDFAWGYLSIALPVGIAMCALMPVAAQITWDGAIHFNNANALSYIFDAQYSGADQLLANNIALQESGTLRMDEVSGLPSADQTALVVSKGNDAYLLEDASVAPVLLTGTEHLGDSSSYVCAAMVGWIPSAVGLWIARLFHLSCLGRFFFGRLGNTLFFIFAIFFAIKNLRSGKLIVGAIGLMPTLLLEAANYSYDPWVTALVTYAFARYASVLQSGKKLALRDSLGFCIPFFFGALVKAVIFPLAFVFLLLPRVQAPTRRERLMNSIIVMGTVICLLASFALPFIFSMGQGTATGDTRGYGESVNPAGQVSYILTNPVTALITGLRFMVDFLDPRIFFFSGNSQSVNFGYSAPYLLSGNSPFVAPLATVAGLLPIAMSFFDRNGCDRSYANWRWRIASFVDCFLAFGVICAAFYVSYTPVGASFIGGVQYRYLPPLMATFLLFVPNLKVLEGVVRGEMLLIGFIAVEIVLQTLVLCSAFLVMF